MLLDRAPGLREPAERELGRDVAVWIVVAVLTSVCLLPFAWFGLAEFWNTLASQLTGPAAVTDFLASYGGGYMARFEPTHLYDAPAFLAYIHVLQGGRQADTLFLNPPFVAPVLELLTLVPYGPAYALAALFNLACYALAAWLIAPRWSFIRLRARSWLLWLVFLPFFLPAQLGLVMGQSEMVTTLAFALFAWSELHAPTWSDRGVLWLLMWAVKPNLLPAFIVAITSARRWRALAMASATVLALTGVSMAMLGPQSAIGFVQANTARFGLATANTANVSEGVTLLTLVQVLVGCGQVAAVLTLAATMSVWLAVGVLWWPGPHQDARRYLQIAVLPIAASLTGIHAGSYELVSWLAAIWLLLRFAALRPAYRPLFGGLFLALWWAGATCILERSPASDAVPVGVGVVVLIACLYVSARERQLSLAGSPFSLRRLLRKSSRSCKTAAELGSSGCVSSAAASTAG